MVRLNSTQLSEAQLVQLFSQFSRAVASLSGSEAGSFLCELLGHEEHVMLAKRFATIVLLVEGVSKYRASRILKISPSTAEKVHAKLEKGEYKQLLKTLGKDKKEYWDILNTLDSILHLGGILPHYNGIDRRWRL